MLISHFATMTSFILDNRSGMLHFNVFNERPHFFLRFNRPLVAFLLDICETNDIDCFNGRNHVKRNSSLQPPRAP